MVDDTDDRGVGDFCRPAGICTKFILGALYLYVVLGSEVWR